MKSTYIQRVADRIMYLQKSGTKPVSVGWGCVDRSWIDALLFRPKWQFGVVYRSQGVEFHEILFRGSPVYLEFLNSCIDWWAIRYQQRNPDSNQPEHDHL